MKKENTIVKVANAYGGGGGGGNLKRVTVLKLSGAL
jgi:hypothetical protein